MPNRSSKKEPRDANQLKKAIVDSATSDEQPDQEHAERAEQPEKNQAAVELGRLGGKKGGKARAEKLTKEQRSEIARKAAEARWKKRKSSH